MKKHKSPRNKPKALSVHRRSEGHAKTHGQKPQAPEMHKNSRESDEDPYLRIYRYYFGD